MLHDNLACLEQFKRDDTLFYLLLIIISFDLAAGPQFNKISLLYLLQFPHV